MDYDEYTMMMDGRPVTISVPFYTASDLQYIHNPNIDRIQQRFQYTEVLYQDHIQDCYRRFKIAVIEGVKPEIAVEMFMPAYTKVL
jgi:hypothetical protein